jgi:acetylornithine deacetylase/succinyl-diaminopimelate desuccinylase-like protein
MLADGLFKRFPKPDFAVALHTVSTAASGTVQFTPGYSMASVDSVDITLHGKGGHGAYPHTTVDPVVLAARTILSLQTLISREKHPLEPAVLTVGSIHGGTKHNIIPDDVKLQLTLRTYKPEVRKALLAGIERVAKAEAMAANAPRPPTVAVTEGTPATFNDPDLTKRLVGAIARVLGQKNLSGDTTRHGRRGLRRVRPRRHPRGDAVARHHRAEAPRPGPGRRGDTALGALAPLRAGPRAHAAHRRHHAHHRRAGAAGQALSNPPAQPTCKSG